jgi:hypothetical protein
MENIKKISFAIILLAFSLVHQSFAQNAGVTKMREQILFMMDDSNTDFYTSQGSATGMPATEEYGNKTTYYKSATKYKGEVSLLRIQERNGVLYKSLIFGWKMDKNTPKDVREEAKNARLAALRIIKEREVAGGYKSFKVKTTDSSMRTELRDSMGGRVIEIVESKNYFHLIVFGIKWRNDTVDGLTSDFTIEGILAEKRKCQSLK